MKPAPDSAVFPFRERKIKHGGTVHDYETELIYRDGRVVIVAFRMARGGGPPLLPVVVPPGSISYGYFWPRRPYNLYRWIGPDGRLVAHRLDALCDVRVSEDGIEYRDLILDWLVYPDGTIVEDDRDELEQGIASGAVSRREAALANEAAYQVLSRYRHIIDEAEELERRHVLRK